MEVLETPNKHILVTVVCYWNYRTDNTRKMCIKTFA